MRTWQRSQLVRCIISKSTGNAIKANSTIIMKQVLAIQMIALDNMEAKCISGSCVAGALKDGGDGARCMPSQSIPECLIVDVMENVLGNGQTHGSSGGAQVLGIYHRVISASWSISVSSCWILLRHISAPIRQK